jgi:hypothetical protein
MRPSLILGVVVALSSAGWPLAPVHAAVRICQSAVSSGLQDARTEKEARALAISAWITAAAVHGASYTAWRLAIGKSLTCSKTTADTYQCLAKAEPCVISQVPPPVEQVPLRKAPGISG